MELLVAAFMASSEPDADSGREFIMVVVAVEGGSMSLSSLLLLLFLSNGLMLWETHNQLASLFLVVVLVLVVADVGM